MVVPAFGFSVGDFIAALQLLDKVATALRQSTGGDKKYQQAVVELNTLSNVLRSVQALQPSTNNVDAIQQIHLCAHACHIPLADFVSKIKKFAPHLDAASTPHGSTPWKHVVRGGRKVEWVVKLETELATLKARIGPLLALIGIMLQASSLDEASRTHDISLETQRLSQGTVLQVRALETFFTKEVATRNQVAALLPAIGNLAVQHDRTYDKSARLIEDSSNAMQRRLDDLERMMRALPLQLSAPASPLASVPNVGSPLSQTTTRRTMNIQSSTVLIQLGETLLAIRKGIAHVFLMLLYLVPAFHRWLRVLTAIAPSPTRLLEDNIKLEDALGRVSELPYAHFRSWSVFEARLRSQFKDCPGEGKVWRNDFRVAALKSHGDYVVAQSTWDRYIMPGERLVMSILLERQEVASLACQECHRSADELELISLRWIRWPLYDNLRAAFDVRRHKPMVHSVSPGEAGQLTDANLDKLEKAERRASGSHILGLNRKSRRSSKMVDSVRVDGDTVTHIYGDADVELLPGEDGAPPRIIINNNNSGGASRDPLRQE